MERVSKILAERERSRARTTVYVVISVFLHGALAASALVVGRINMSKPAQLPSVSVRLVRPEPRPPRRTRRNPQRQAAPQATPRPQPTKAPVPTPVAVAPTAAPEPVAHSAEAMAAPDATPQPTPPPMEGGGTGGRGLSLAEEGGGGPPAIPSDFQFAYYVDRMLALIESRWYKPPVPSGTRARIRFTILKSGRVERIELEESSNVPTFDRAALRALYAANPLPPLPPAYSKSSLTIHLTFSE